MIVCAGHAAYDLTFAVPELPQANRKYHLPDAPGSAGGPAANAASLLARWGQTVRLAVPLGTDAFGDAILADWAADGVGTDLVARDALPTPVSMVLVTPDGERSIVTRRPQRPSLAVSAAALDALGSVTGLVFDGHEPELSLELLDRYPNAWSLLDAGTLRPGTETLAVRVTHVIASERFTEALVRRRYPAFPWVSGASKAVAAGLDALTEVCPRWSAVTLGAGGCAWRDGGQTYHQPALPVTAVDTTGAGDVFHGAFAFALAEGQTSRDAVRLATAAAGLSVQSTGGRAAIPSLESARGALPLLPEVKQGY